MAGEANTVRLSVVCDIAGYVPEAVSDSDGDVERVDVLARLRATAATPVVASTGGDRE